MELSNLVVRLCLAGTEAEFQGKIDEAHNLYQQAWEAVQDDYDACIAAHYLARHQDSPEARLHWNLIALDKADAVADHRVQAFYPSLFLNVGQSYELMGRSEEAQRYYDRAASLGFPHQPENRQKNAP